MLQAVALTSRLRRVFFERDLGDLELQVLADPAEQQVLVLPQVAADPALLEIERVARALERVGLLDRVVPDRSRWQQLDGVVAIPWQHLAVGSDAEEVRA